MTRGSRFRGAYPDSVHEEIREFPRAGGSEFRHHEPPDFERSGRGVYVYERAGELRWDRVVGVGQQSRFGGSGGSAAVYTDGELIRRVGNVCAETRGEAEWDGVGSGWVAAWGGDRGAREFAAAVLCFSAADDGCERAFQFSLFAGAGGVFDDSGEGVCRS